MVADTMDDNEWMLKARSSAIQMVLERNSDILNDFHNK